MSSELRKCLTSCRSAFVTIGLLSGGSNLLALTGSIFMLAVYDRVIPSGSIPTLVALGLIALVLYAMQAVTDIVRGRILTRLGLVIKEAFSSRSFDVIVRNAAAGNHRTSGAVRDLDQIQGYLSSLGLAALFDLPWIPLYLGICFAFHPYIGFSVLAGAVVLVALTFLSNFLTRDPSRELNDLTNRRASLLASSQANAETIQAMGMTLAMSAAWNRVDARIVRVHRSIADTGTTLGTLSKAARMALQSFVLAVGAYLVIQQEATGGVMIASAILSARALAPIELTVAHWKSLVQARQSWLRLDELFKTNPPEAELFATPPPSRAIACMNVSLCAPGTRRLIVRDVSFQIRAGEGLGIIGSTGSGKSTLARSLVGLWEPANGAIHLDGLPLTRWSGLERGRFIGYLPQNVSLFEGTIAQNIARFDPYADAAKIVQIAKTAGVHDMISRLPEGYDTRIGAGGSGLSGGQSQRIGLARALFGDPFLVVLDEPNSNLDNVGEFALQGAIDSVKKRGGIVILVTHRPSILAMVEQVLVLADGRVKKFGAREEVLESVTRPPQVQPVATGENKPRIAGAVGEAGK